MTRTIMEINEIFNFSDQKKKDIIAILTKMQIPSNSYTINKDYTVDTTRDVSIFNKNYEECPVVFNNANGNFIWHYSKIKSLKNFPVNVEGNLTVMSNKITSLENSTVNEVKGTFNISNNKLKNLKGGPKCVGNIVCVSCGLESLDGSPIEVRGDFTCSNNNLTSVKSSTFYIGGTFDCSNNKLKNLIDLPLCSKIKYDGNSLQDTQLELVFPEFQINDDVIYKKEGSKYNNLKGRISSIEDGSSEDPDEKYQIAFYPPESDKTIIHIDKKYIEKIEKSTVNRKKEDLSIGTEVVYLHKEKKYFGIIREELSNGLLNVEFKSSDGEKLMYIAHKNNLKIKFKKIVSYPSKVEEYNCSDHIIYLDPGGEFDEKEGTISSISYLKSGTVYNIKIKDNNGADRWIRDVKPEKLERAPISKDIPETKTEIPKENIFKLTDKIIYVKRGDVDNNCRGTIVFVNTYQKDYDISIVDHLGHIKRVNFVNPKNIKRFIEKFEKGDKIIYDNPSDKQFNKRIGAIKSVNKDKKYTVIFNIDGKLTTIIDVESTSLIKFEPIDDISVNDDIIYTKIDSNYYMCKGCVTSYSISDDTYEIQIISKDNKRIKIKKAKLQNIEKQPPKREFKKGDIIRYVNNRSPYEGYEGIVDKKISKDKYDITLKKGTTYVYLVTLSEHLVLLEESKETIELKYGQSIIYKKSDSKYNNRTGTFKGIRSDGQYELELPYSAGDPYVKLFVDGEYVFPHEETKNTTTYIVGNRKKKKKEKEEPRPPVLVYNRRNVARKAGKRNLPDPDEIINKDE